MLLSLIFMALGTVLGGEAEIANRRDENLLLHQRVTLSHLRVFDRAQGEWRVPDVKEQPQGQLLVVHLWADYCQPCLEEFPWLRSMSARLGGGDARFVFIAESPTASREMQSFLQKHDDRMPSGLLYQDTNGALFQGLPVRRLPITLLVDSEGGVRQAFLGSIQERRGELVDAILRLQRFLRQRPERAAVRRRGEP